MPDRDEIDGKAGADRQGSFLEAPLPDHSGHRQRLRDRFRKGGADALPDYELLELVLFRALPRRDTKGIAKKLLARFGSFAEVVNAPEPRLKELQDAGAVIMEASARLSACGAELRAPRAVPHSVSRQAQPTHRRRGARPGHRRPHAG